ncbi:MAG: ABC transporter permease [Myxococcota bacterium]|nr:ABC transporter permease [Myxococcota bacterium]
MRHVTAIASRELRSLFVSPVAYVVLSLFAVLAGFLFLASVLSFDANLAQAQQFQAFDFLRQLNLNDHLIAPFLQVMWIVFLILVPAVTMSLFASEKANGTEELLLTSPLTIWELVLGKYLAAAGFVTLLVGMLGLFCGIIFLYGEPEPLKTLSGLLGVWLVGLSYAAIGVFTSSLTRNQLVAFFIALPLILMLWLLSVFADLGGATGAVGSESGLSALLRWLSTSDHFQQLIEGLVDTRALAHFAFMIGTFLVLTKASVESVRWR